MLTRLLLAATLTIDQKPVDCMVKDQFPRIEAGVQPASYAWNFGDGIAEQTGSGPALAHVFPVVGRFLEVTYGAPHRRGRQGRARLGQPDRQGDQPAGADLRRVQVGR